MASENASATPQYEPLPWTRSPLPKSIGLIPKNEADDLLEKFDALVERRATPADDWGREAGRQIYWPCDASRVRVLPDGILFLEEEGPEHAEKLEAKLKVLFPRGVAVWGIGQSKHGVFNGAYDATLRHWVKAELIFSPVAVMSLDASFFMVCDEQLRFTVLGGAPHVLSEVDEAFGGVATLRLLFNQYVDDCGIGFGDPDRQWARGHLTSW
ncbi:hypothetical protein [Maricaulis sp.]|uniref:hypothetical protein n=1 Tax=Maricaulis sp. TaxID=1486257 RepID=UPI00263A3752|nr:hypothetical protein [Maricaulis sp.]